MLQIYLLNRAIIHHEQEETVEGDHPRRLGVVIIIASVGKTSLLNSYVDQKFVQAYKATVGADFMEKEVVVDGKVINLEVHFAKPRYGTLPVRRNSAVWEAPSIEVRIAVCSSTISPTSK